MLRRLGAVATSTKRVGPLHADLRHGELRERESTVGNAVGRTLTTVYTEIITVLGDLRGSIEAIERRDADLGRQMRRASSSVALNAAEAQGSRGRNQQVRFSTALGSMRETKACLDVGAAFGYVDVVDAAVTRRIDRICGMLYRLSR